MPPFPFFLLCHLPPFPCSSSEGSSGRVSSTSTLPDGSSASYVTPLPPSRARPSIHSLPPPPVYSRHSTGIQCPSPSLDLSAGPPHSLVIQPSIAFHRIRRNTIKGSPFWCCHLISQAWNFRSPPSYLRELKPSSPRPSSPNTFQASCLRSRPSPQNPQQKPDTTPT